MLFGPVVGGIMGGVADIIKYLLKPTGPFFFGFTFNAILGAVIYGVMLYKSRSALKNIGVKDCCGNRCQCIFEYVLAFDVVWKCIYGNFTATSDQTDHHGADTVDHVVCGC